MVEETRAGANLGTAVAVGQLPGGHAAGGEGRDLVGVVNAAHPDDVVLVGWVVKRAVQRPIVPNC